MFPFSAKKAVSNERSLPFLLIVDKISLPTSMECKEFFHSKENSKGSIHFQKSIIPVKQKVPLSKSLVLLNKLADCIIVLSGKWDFIFGKVPITIVFIILNIKNLWAGIAIKSFFISIDFIMPISPNSRKYRSKELILARSARGAGCFRYALERIP